MSLERKLARQKAKFERDNPNGTVFVGGKPIAIISQAPDGGNIFRVFSPDGEWKRYELYATLVADFVRHIANCFNVPEGKVWEWVDRERYYQTSPVTLLPDDYTAARRSSCPQLNASSYSEAVDRSPGALMHIEPAENDTTMTVDALLAALDRCKTLYPADDVREVLTEILYAAGNFFDNRTTSPAGSYAGACWGVLCLAAYLVRAGDIDEKVAIEITDKLGSIASFTLEVVDGLSAATRARLEQIEHVAVLAHTHRR